jgi:hypothetical protein
MKAWRGRVTFTQGRVYSTVIVVAVLALLVPGLTHWKPVAATKPLSGVRFTAHPPAPSSPAPSAAAPAVTPSLAPPTLGSLSVPNAGLGLPPVPSTPLLSGPLTSPPLTAPVQTVSPGATCAAASLNKAVTAQLTQLNAMLKILPTATIETALGLATGCNTANPALLAVGALSELGDDLSTAFNQVPGAAGLKLPAVPALLVPKALLPLLGSLKPVFAPICADVNTATNIVLLIAPHYPQVIDGATALALFQSAVTCAELTGAGAGT